MAYRLVHHGGLLTLAQTQGWKQLRGISCKGISVNRTEEYIQTEQATHASQDSSSSGALAAAYDVGNCSATRQSQLPCTEPSISPSGTNDSSYDDRSASVVRISPSHKSHKDHRMQQRGGVDRLARETAIHDDIPRFRVEESIAAPTCMQALSRDPDSGGVIRAIVEWEEAGRVLCGGQERCAAEDVYACDDFENAVATAQLVVALSGSLRHVPGRLDAIRNAFNGTYLVDLSEGHAREDGPVGMVSDGSDGDRADVPWTESGVVKAPLSDYHESGGRIKLRTPHDLEKCPPSRADADADVMELDTARGKLRCMVAPLSLGEAYPLPFNDGIEAIIERIHQGYESAARGMRETVYPEVPAACTSRILTVRRTIEEKREEIDSAAAGMIDPDATHFAVWKAPGLQRIYELPDCLPGACSAGEATGIRSGGAASAGIVAARIPLQNSGFEPSTGTDAVYWMHLTATLDVSSAGVVLGRVEYLHQAATQRLGLIDGYWCYCKSWSCCRIFCTSYPWRACLVGWLDCCHVTVPLVVWFAVAQALIWGAIPLACTKAIVQDRLFNGTFAGYSVEFANTADANLSAQILDDAVAKCSSTSILEWGSDESRPSDALDALDSFRLRAWLQYLWIVVCACAVPVVCLVCFKLLWGCRNEADAVKLTPWMLLLWSTWDADTITDDVSFTIRPWSWSSANWLEEPGYAETTPRLPRELEKHELELMDKMGSSVAAELASVLSLSVVLACLSLLPEESIVSVHTFEAFGIASGVALIVALVALQCLDVFRLVVRGSDGKVLPRDGVCCPPMQQLAIGCCRLSVARFDLALLGGLLLVCAALLAASPGGSISSNAQTGIVCGYAGIWVFSTFMRLVVCNRMACRCGPVELYRRVFLCQEPARGLTDLQAATCTSELQAAELVHACVAIVLLIACAAVVGRDVRLLHPWVLLWIVVQALGKSWAFATHDIVCGRSCSPTKHRACWDSATTCFWARYPCCGALAPYQKHTYAGKIQELSFSMQLIDSLWGSVHGENDGSDAQGRAFKTFEPVVSPNSPVLLLRSPCFCDEFIARLNLVRQAVNRGFVATDANCFPRYNIPEQAQYRKRNKHWQPQLASCALKQLQVASDLLLLHEARNRKVSGDRLLRLHLRLEALYGATLPIHASANAYDNCRTQTETGASPGPVMIGRSHFLDSFEIDPAQVRALSAAALGAAMYVLGGPRYLVRAFVGLLYSRQHSSQCAQEGEFASHFASGSAAAPASASGAAALRGAPGVYDRLAVANALDAGRRAWQCMIGTLDEAQITTKSDPDPSSDCNSHGGIRDSPLWMGSQRRSRLGWTSPCASIVVDLGGGKTVYSSPASCLMSPDDAHRVFEIPAWAVQSDGDSEDSGFGNSV